MSYTHTVLWAGSFGDLPDDPYREQRGVLRESYLALRKRAEALVANISGDLRQFTVHDITHLDALWGIASEIAGPEFSLTPTEAFILGASFLLHDAGMCLAAYPGGLEELKQHKLWSGTLRKFARDPDRPLDSELSSTVASLLRSEHANRARDLAFSEWQSGAGAKYYLIENADLRQKFASAIGEVAASHWWSHDKLASSLDRVLPAPPPFPTEWRVDLLKVASILRVADAAHVDERRAPGFVWSLKRPLLNEESNLHWLFQNRLTQPERRADAIYYGSTSDFVLSEAGSWWLAYDTLKMIDEELRRTDVLLADLRGTESRLTARRVANVESTKTMMSSLRVRDWIPVDTSIKISDVPSLVQSLGGQALYGKNPLVPLRELVQNASDAIRLKAEIVPNFSLSDGRIKVRIGVIDDRYFLEVSDNGIGMTKDIVSGPFLDFGNSGWSTEPVFSDYPDADPQKLNLIGKFGIGFFSVFMLGDQVEVITRRFDKGFGETLVLSFANGIIRRPILREGSRDEWLTESGTSIRVWLRESPSSLESFFGNEKRSLSNTCQQQFPISEVAISTQVNDDCKTIPPIDWQRADAATLLARIFGRAEVPAILKPFFKNLRALHDTAGKVVGRMFLAPISLRFLDDNSDLEFGGAVTSRGVFVSSAHGLYGFVEGEVTTANRSIAYPKPDRSEFHRWLKEQAGLLAAMNLPVDEQIRCSELIHALGGDVGELAICRCKDVGLSKRELTKFLMTATVVTIANTYELANLKKLNPSAEAVENLLEVETGYMSVFPAGFGFDSEGFDYVLRGKDWDADLSSLVISIVQECWSLDDDLIDAVRRFRLADRKISKQVAIARSSDGHAISAYGRVLRKGMTLTDLNFVSSN